MLLASEWDTVVVPSWVGCVSEVAGNDTEFWTAYREAAVELASVIVEEKPGSGLFLVSCPVHGMYYTFWWDWFYVTTLDGGEEVMKNLIDNWLHDITPNKAVDGPEGVNPGCYWG